jgi:hypothetical protein
MRTYVSEDAAGRVDAVCGARLVSEIGLCVSRRVLGVVGGSQWPGAAGWVLFLWYFYSLLLNIMLCFLFGSNLVVILIRASHFIDD